MQGLFATTVHAGFKYTVLFSSGNAVAKKKKRKNDAGRNSLISLKKYEIGPVIFWRLQDCVYKILSPSTTTKVESK
jgi:hypothetical protein